MKQKSLAILIGAIILCELAGIIGSLFTFSAIPGWYVQLQKPSFSPPNWLFGPVWTILYALMGISLYFVWQKKTDGAKQLKQKNFALLAFAVQLVLNAVWSIIFFGFKQLGIAFLEIVLLWLSIVVTIFLFYKIEKKAAWLLVPYLLWVSFASILNLAVFLLNK